MTTPKLCEHCSTPLAPTPAQWARGMRTATKRFCDHACAAQWKKRGKQADVLCPGCGVAFQTASWRTKDQAKVYCTPGCYQAAHAALPRVCPTCVQPFVSKSYRATQRYCCVACRPMKGADNPNFGKKHPGLFAHTAQFRLWLSTLRTGKANPAWAGGSPSAGAWQHQTWVSRWAAKNIAPQCAECGAAPGHVHHIVPGRFFAPRLLMQFRQNIVLLCDLHQRHAVQAATPLLRQGTPRLIPFADRLPQSILEALEQGGSVSSPLPGCDYAPLGNIGELIHAGHWQNGTGEAQRASAPGA